MGNRTFTPIQSVTLGSDAASVTFSDIPQGYRDLVVVCQAQSTTVDVGTGFFRLNFNGDTGANYSDTLLFGNGTSPGNNRASSSAYIRLLIPYANASGVVPPIFTMSVVSYANTNVFKTTLIEEATVVYATRRVGLWRSTAAVTSLSLSVPANSMKSGSQFTLFGIGE